MAGMPAAIATSGGTRKPFSYCPGGIDFSELKSPKMAKRIAKHQSGMTATPASAPSPTMGMPSPTPKQPIPQTNTLPNYSTGSSQPKPQFGRQRSISDLLSTPSDTPVPSTLPQVGSSPIFTYNPYASDRSISIPPPTPPPIIPQQTVDPVNRANSLPPGAAPMAPARNTTLHHQPKNTPGRPGLPPRHPVHQLLQSQTQNEEPLYKSATLPSGQQTHEYQEVPNYQTGAPLPPPMQGAPPPMSMQGAFSPVQMAPQPPLMPGGPPPPPTPMHGTLPPPPMQGAPPPPPPPPPPPGSLGIVAKCGLSGVPLPGKKQVRATISLAEIRAGNSYLEPDPVEEVTPVVAATPSQNPIIADTSSVYQQQPEPVYPNNMLQANELQAKSLSGAVIPLSHQDKTRENGFVESLHEFEAQRNAMMSPPATSRNINNFPDSRIDSSISPFSSQENAFNQGNQTYSTLPPAFKPSSADTSAASQIPLSVVELNNQTLPRKEPAVFQGQINFNETELRKSNLPEYSSPKIETTYNTLPPPPPPMSENLYQTPINENTYKYPSPPRSEISYNTLPSPPKPESLYQSQSSPKSGIGYQPQSPSKSENMYEPTSPIKSDTGPQPKLNDDIKMSRPRERSIPRQQSLQRDCEGHNVTPNAYKQETQDSKPKYTLPAQKSIDNDEPELMEINGHSGRRDSDANSQGYVRYRPETPRIVTPVRFTATPKLSNRGLNRQPSIQDKPQNIPLPPKPSEKSKPVSEDVKMISRNVSDSGISVNSSTPEPDETAGKIVTESMQKIEAQMKKILSSENVDVPDKIENSGSTSSVNSLNQVTTDSKRGSISNGQDALPSTYSTMSGYSTCSEEELKFEEPKINIPLKTAPFEVMEDFEEAPEEFDLGISSYSISHPVETEEMEKTPVPEVLDNNDTTKQNYEDTPYRVSPPTRTGTLEFEKKAKPVLQNQYSQPQQPSTQQQYPQHQFTQQQYPQQQHQQPMTPNTPLNSPFITPQHNMFNQMNMPNMSLPNMPNMNLPSMPNMMGMTPLHPMFEESFTQFPNMFDQPFQNPGMFNSFPSMPVSTPYQPKPQQDEKQTGERIIPIKVVHTNSESLINNSNYSNQTRHIPTEEYRPAQKTIDVPILIENNSPKKHEATPPTFQSPQKQAYSQPRHDVSPPNKYSPPTFSPSPKEVTPVNKYSPQSYPSSPKEATPINKYSPPNYSSSSKEVTPVNKYSPPKYHSPPKQHIPSPPTPPTPPTVSQQTKNHDRKDSFSNTLPARNSAVSPQTVRYGTSSNSAPRNSQMSPVPTASMLQNQLSQMQNRKTEERQMPIRNQSAEEQRPVFQRSSSVAADNIKSRLVQKTKTPTYNDLQFRYGNKHSPSPVLDKDYQKEARQTVVGELSRYGGVQQASKIAGRRKPSQSPSMRLLGMLHVHDDPDDDDDDEDF